MDDEGRRPGRRAPRPPTEAGVRAHAQAYLSERSTSRAHLRRLLLRRAERANARCEEAQRVPREVLRTWVDAALDAASCAHLVDDTRYASDKAATLARRGGSDAVIRARLHEKGVAATDIEHALETLGTRSDRALAGALSLARRRRVGPFRDKPAERQRELGILARGGFSWEIATRVLAMTLEEAEDALSGTI
jgi:regulatory protein